MLLGRHYERLHGLCRRMLGNDQDALDATQEALIAIVRGLPRFDGRCAFSTWAYRVATNSSLDELRRRRRRPSPGLPESQHATTSHGERSGEAPRLAIDWVDLADDVSGRFDVDAALQCLPPEQRAAVVLRDLLDLDYSEIADVLDVPIGTVRSRIARGRGAMAALLADRQEKRDDHSHEVSGPLQSGKGNSVPGLERQRNEDR